jgi:putative N6-adenine-specific DNA methylase
MRWPGFDEIAWKARIARMIAEVVPAGGSVILAADRDAGAVDATRANAERAGVGGDIELRRQSITALELPPAPGWLVTNPPYGVRVGDSGPLRNLYAGLGKVLRTHGAGWTVGMLSADRALERQVGVALSEVFRTSNGGIPVRLIRGSVADVTVRNVPGSYRSQRRKTRSGGGQPGDGVRTGGAGDVDD